MDDSRAIITTLDFFPPVVDDPYYFGAIAAANALSDVYAMGGQPLLATNLAAFPDGLDLGILTEILRGGAEKVREAGAVIAGGHTVTDKEPKYGLSVIGEVHPERIIRKGGARIGDRLILTKPLGVGVITTALKRGQASDEAVQDAIDGMLRLNRAGAALAHQYNVHAMTDITGYSLLGHSHEMAHLGEVALNFDHSAFQWYKGSLAYGEADIFPGGMSRNREYFEPWVRFSDKVPAFMQDLLFDPQTSGGLLIAVAADKAEAMLAHLRELGDAANIVGHVESGNGQIHVS